MQATAQQMQEQLWANLQAVYDRYAERAGGQIPTAKVQQIVYETLGEQSQQEIDYVIKNMFRLDADENGSVSFLEFANFLFKRHCGQMSLQRMHLKGKMSKGSERKMTYQQFHTLMNNAYKFLGVQCPNQVTESIFNETDKDKDALITYVEYFQVIDRYICRKDIPKVEKKPIVEQGPERFSKLRILIWTNLKKLYEAYVAGRLLNATDIQLRSLIVAITGYLSQNELLFIIYGIFQMDLKTIEFYSFACRFLYLVAELGLSRFRQNHPPKKSTLNKHEFTLLFKNSYNFLRISKMKDQFLWLHFNKIDKNHDGFITYEEYLDWIRRFIAVVHYFGDQFYVLEDDQKNADFEIFEVEPPVKVQTRKTPVKFHFSDLSLAYRVRETCYNLLQKYDVNKDTLFDESQIHAALTDLLKQNQYQLAYVTRNVFRYDKDGDKNVTYDQLTNFCVEQHFGEMAIQRLHRQNSYSKGRQRIMNQEEFAKTLRYALSFIQIDPSDDILKLLFRQIDLDNDGWISYQVYFLFLRYYFGSLSEAARGKTVQKVKLSKDEEFLLSLKDLSPIDRFVRILLDQLRPMCLQYDFNKNLVFQIDQIEAILINIFKLEEEEVSYVTYHYFRFSSRKENYVTYEEMIAIILEIYFIEIFFRRRYNTKNSENWKNRLLSLDEFITQIQEACFFVRVKPPREDLKAIFELADLNKDGTISFDEYIAFIRKYLGKGLQIIDESHKKEQKANSSIPEVSQEQLQFIEALWGQLKKYFDQYDQGNKGYLKQQELKSFAVEVLRETSKRQLEYIFWNLFRVDTNYNREVDFNQFAPFILCHAAEISLQRFHREQTKGKSALDEEELFIVLKNAYNFLSTMPKSRNIVQIIFKRISKNGQCTYGNFLSWINLALAKRFR